MKWVSSLLIFVFLFLLILGSGCATSTSSDKTSSIVYENVSTPEDLKPIILPEVPVVEPAPSKEPIILTAVNTNLNPIHYYTIEIDVPGNSLSIKFLNNTSVFLSDVQFNYEILDTAENVIDSGVAEIISGTNDFPRGEEKDVQIRIPFAANGYYYTLHFLLPSGQDLWDVGGGASQTQYQGFCGNLACEKGETSYNCSHDCGSLPNVFCGDGICSSTESCYYCPSDCTGCPLPVCGDGTCSPGEFCQDCSADCGTCATTTCTESWSCDLWSWCVNGKQTRNCQDDNACGTNQFAFPEERSCTYASYQYTPTGPAVTMQNSMSADIRAFTAVSIGCPSSTPSKKYSCFEIVFRGVNNTAQTGQITVRPTMNAQSPYWSAFDAQNNSYSVQLPTNCENGSLSANFYLAPGETKEDSFCVAIENFSMTTTKVSIPVTFYAFEYNESSSALTPVGEMALPVTVDIQVIE